MTRSSVVVIVPIVAAVTLAFWLIAVYLADRESSKKGRGQQPSTATPWRRSPTASVTQDPGRPRRHPRRLGISADGVPSLDRRSRDVHGQLHTDLPRALYEISADRDNRVLVLTGGR